MRGDIEYAVIGGGVIGWSIARALQRKAGEVVVVDRSKRGQTENQSTRNSGVIHAGIYYKAAQRPLKAHLCVAGNAMLYTFCEQHSVRHARTGKLVVATNANEEDYLADVYATALANQVPGLRLLDAQEARAMEPNVVATQALYAPSSGVIDAAHYLKTLRRVAKAHALEGTEVVDISPCAEGFRIETEVGSQRESFVANRIINAAGLYSDDVARMINPNSGYHLMPVRGEAAKFYSTRRPELAMAGMNVYPVPCGIYVDDGSRAADLPFSKFCKLLAEGKLMDTLGVHITPTLDEQGRVSSTATLCPAIVAGVGKEDYVNTLAPDYYRQRVHAFFPGLQPSDIELHQTGIQARLAGQLDWVMQADQEHTNFINLIGIDSPGLTASLAIADYVVDTLL